MEQRRYLEDDLNSGGVKGNLYRPYGGHAFFVKEFKLTQVGAGACIHTHNLCVGLDVSYGEGFGCPIPDTTRITERDLTPAEAHRLFAFLDRSEPGQLEAEAKEEKRRLDIIHILTPERDDEIRQVTLAQRDICYSLVPGEDNLYIENPQTASSAQQSR